MLARKNMSADTSPLKRSFGEAAGQELKFYSFVNQQHAQENGHKNSLIKLQHHRSVSEFSPTKRRSITISRSTSMPLQSSNSVSTIFPSFMSVFGSGGSQEDARQEKTVLNDKTPGAEDINSHNISEHTHQTHHTLPSPRDHHRSDSVSSLTSESTDSSPTTTISTFDSPIVTDPSPSSSPETPSVTLPLSPFRSMMRPSEEPDKGRRSRDNSLSEAGSGERTQSESPADSNPRNVKNLSLRTTPSLLTRPATSSGIEGQTLQSLSADNSPLKEPLKTGRRKPPGLSIQTPGFVPLSFTKTASDVPPTPSGRPSLLQVQSSPQFPTLVASAGGLRLPLPNIRGAHGRPDSQSSSTHSVGSSLHDLKEEDDGGPLRSQETAERGYTDGPVLIYDSGLYLYLEPTAKEASEFDTVINVAKEVKNPFDITTSESPDSVASIWRNGSDRSKIPEPQTAVSEVSFKSAFEWPTSDLNTTPTTPKAASPTRKPLPKYVHVPWDHNSEIVDDLFPLCQLIDVEIRSGKKVLVHCQLGVSRSASLVIAYGLYKGFQPEFHSMYASVKDRSQWVGPNMSLIYQLMDFRTRVEKGAMSVKAAPQEWFFVHGTTSADESTTPKVSAMSTDIHEQATPPLPPPKKSVPNFSRPNLSKALPPVPLFSSEKTPKTAFLQPEKPSDPNTTITAAPLPPPPVAFQNTTTKSRSPRPLPLRNFAPLIEIPPHRTQHAQVATAQRSHPSAQMDLAVQDEPETPSLFSPRATEFMASPFGRTAAGEIMMGSVPSTTVPTSVGPSRTDRPAAVDPRSPHQAQEGGEIVRNIDSFL